MRRRRALIAAGAAGLVLVGLAGVAAVTTGRDSTDGPVPIALGSGAQRNGDGGGGAEAKMAADASLIAPAWQPPIFVVPGDLPSLGGEAPAYRFAASARASVDDVRRVAAALGMTDEPVELSAEEGGGYRVGPADGSGPSLYVTASPMGDWYYSGPASAYAERCMAVDPAAGASGGGDTGTDTTTNVAAATTATPGITKECAEPEPPANVPTAAEAEAKARALYEALGVDLSDAVVSSWGDEWAAGVNLQRRLDGVPAPLWLGASYGGDGVLQGANGWLVEPERIEGYPLVDTAAALERLRSGEQQWFGGYGGTASLSARSAEAAAAGAGGASGAATEPAVASDDAPVSNAATTPAVGVPEPAPLPADQPVTIEPVPVEPTEPVEVVLTGVERSLLQVWSPDGTVWLLPAYAFTTDDGGRWEVLAVADDYLVAPAPVVTGTPATTAPAETVPPPTTAVTPTVPETVPETLPPATVPASTAEELAKAIIGLSEVEATDRAAAAGLTVRVVEIDGVSQEVTADYVETRVNLTIAGGMVVDARVG